MFYTIGYLLDSPAGDVLRKFLAEHIALALRAHAGDQELPFKSIECRNCILQVFFIVIVALVTFPFLIGQPQLEGPVADGTAGRNIVGILGLLLIQDIQNQLQQFLRVSGSNTFCLPIAGLQIEIINVLPFRILTHQQKIKLYMLSIQNIHHL